MTFGDLASGMISQIIKSRRKAIAFFMGFSIVIVFVYLFCLNRASNYIFYLVIIVMGMGTGYWTLFVTVAAE